ncbi:hypothetical protein EC991_009597 [Linnemannia zychae]|nr:hypothetical protein EC991_009597 [Linnemannia zychae]
MKSFLSRKEQQQASPLTSHINVHVPQTPSQIALSIPEILEHILSFVSPKDRQDITQLVCKLWQSICKSLTPISFTWPLCLPDNENQSLIDIVHTAHYLIIRVYQGKHEKERSDSWTVMMKILSEMIRERRQPKLQRLHLMSGVIIDLYVQLQELPTLSYLTTLHIDRETGWDIMGVFSIFAACPNLNELVVKPTLATHYRNGTRSPTPEPSQEELLANGNQPPMRRLQICFLHNAWVTPLALKVFLESCPQLIELALVDFRLFTRGGNMNIHIRNRGPIINLVGTHCPTLKRLHLSACNDSFLNADLTSILEQFPALEEYTFSDRDAGLTLVNGLRTFVNRVTTLNLLSTHLGYLSRTDILRTILCTFEHLVHLRAPNLFYFHEDMDVNSIRGRVHSRWNNSRSQLDHAMTDHPTEKYVWVCRGLRTLHMSVSGRRSDSSCFSKSLIMFGFLSRMCPQLQELHLKRRMMDLTFKGGLCLLSRLQELERINLSTAFSSPLDHHDFSWMRLTPSTMDRISYPVSQYKSKRDIRHLYSRLPDIQPASIAGRNKMINDGNKLQMDLTKVGLPEDLAEWTNERYGPGKLPTWPKLQQFTIGTTEQSYNLVNQMYAFKMAEAFIKKIRPETDVQIRCA